MQTVCVAPPSAELQPLASSKPPVKLDFHDYSMLNHIAKLRGFRYELASCASTRFLARVFRDVDEALVAGEWFNTYENARAFLEFEAQTRELRMV